MNLDRRLLRQVWGARAGLALAVGLGLAAGVVLVVQARLLSQVVGRAFLQGATLPLLRPLLTIWLGLAVLRAGLGWFSEVAAGRVAGRVKLALRGRLIDHLMALGPAFNRAERSGELTNTVTEGVEALDAYLSQYLPQLALAALVPCAILFFVFPLDPWSALILLFTAPLIPFFMVLVGNAADSLTRRQWASLSRMSAHFLDTLQGLTTLKLLGRSREQLATIAQVSDRYRHTTLGVLRVAFLSALTLELLSTISTAVVAVQIGLRLLDGRLGFEQAFFVLLLAPEFYLPLRLLGTRFHAGIAGVTAAKRIYDILETPIAPIPAVAVLAADAPARLDGDIVFQGVGLRYGDDRQPALEGLDLRLPWGKSTALVGPSGAGKSSVAFLLLRFAEPDRGMIMVGEQPLHQVSPDAWRRLVAWVPQDPYLLNATVLDNLRLARPGATVDEILWAAELAHLDEVIRLLPKAYDTVIGERGHRLSGGQAQRIALARAFLKDASLVILDEATANLDPIHERLIVDAIDRLLRGRTALVIAHRLNTVRRADSIAVLQAGRLVELGTHQALLQSGGLYRRLVEAAGARGGGRPQDRPEVGS